MDAMSWPERHPELSDGAIRVRPFVPADAHWVHAAGQDPEIQRWTRVPVPYTPADAEAFVGSFAPQQWRDRIGWHCAVVDVDGTSLGASALVVTDAEAAVAEAGYWIAPAHRGRGAATAALRLLTDWGFDALGLRRIELHVDPRNLASIAVGGRVGFTSEGVLRQRTRRLGEQRDVQMLAKVVAAED